MMELHYKEDDAPLYRSLDAVPISDNVRGIAQELESQIDRPVIYWLDFTGDKNYSNRHPFFQNQFWVTVISQKQQSELNRLVLAGLYRGVLDRKRLLWAFPKQEYEVQVTEYSDEGHRSSAYKMVQNINAFVSTIDAELFLQQYNIKTTEEALQTLLNSKISNLEDYIQKQADSRPTGRLYGWHKESEVYNILDLSNLYRRGGKYQYWVEKMINKLQPKSVRAEYLRKINTISNAVKTAVSNYTNNSVRNVHDTLLESILTELKIERWIDARRWDVKEGEIPIPQAGMRKVYSYIPEDLPNQEFLVKSIRYAREFISLVEEYCRIFDSETNYPVTSITLVDSSYPAACVNGNANDGYFISFMSGIFYELQDRVEKVTINPSVANEYNCCWPGTDVREELYKYAVFFIAAHEYGHILNGDCEPTTRNNLDKESNANARALLLLTMLLGTQNKYHGRKAYPAGVVADNNLLVEAMSIVKDCFGKQIFG